MPIQFIDGNKLKSCRTGLTNYIRIISCYWLLMPWQTHRHTSTQTDRQTDRQTHTHMTCKQKWFHEIRHMWFAASCAWFKHEVGITIAGYPLYRQRWLLFVSVHANTIIAGYSYIYICTNEYLFWLFSSNMHIRQRCQSRYCTSHRRRHIN